MLNTAGPQHPWGLPKFSCHPFLTFGPDYGHALKFQLLASERGSTHLVISVLGVALCSSFKVLFIIVVVV